ncbi:MAG: polyprenyl synthetase family protein, partial [Crocinitomicaceae bacterium]|nr:polyprenyl synthetase family protein [Crocinitomicaceae bacterium]
LLQIEKARDLNIDEETYFEVIRKKTASLIATCCEAGAISVHANADQQEKMRKFGELIGLAFQIKDDIFDYGTGEHIGKPTGIDIREQKMTLPLIYVMNHSPSEIRKELMYIMKNEFDVTARIKRAIQLVIQYGGIQFATQKMETIAKEALELLESFPDNDAKKSLIGLVHYTMNREK